jgi:hypothetical protein
MSLLRDREQAGLADLNAFGTGLLQRYEQLLEADLGDPLDRALRHLLAGRRPLIDALAQCEAARGDLPKAPDQEINDFRAAADRVLGALFGPQIPAGLVLEAEAAWRERLRAAQALNWAQSERELLAALTADAGDAQRTLQLLELRRSD